jgi:transcriptional regulator with XRE-family HTH domain
MDVRRLVGKNLRRLRLEKGWSQEELAFRAKLDRTYVSGVERGVRNPTVLVLSQLGDALGIEEALLLDRAPHRSYSTAIPTRERYEPS